MTNEIISVLIALPIGLWCVGGICLYVHYSDEINTMNKKQFALIVLSGGPFTWGLFILFIFATILGYLENPLKIIGKWYHNFYMYLGNIETKRVKCPYCNLKPLQSTMIRYGMCGMCHKHGKGYDNRRIK